jgi:hypothetical protein
MHEEHVAGIRYRVVVQGRLGERFSALFDGLECEARMGESVLTGAFDQARLHALLDRLRAPGWVGSTPAPLR